MLVRVREVGQAKLTLAEEWGGRIKKLPDWRRDFMVIRVCPGYIPDINRVYPGCSIITSNMKAFAALKYHDRCFLEEDKLSAQGE
jgi:hypothetical protein